MKCGWCLTEAVDKRGRCDECGAQREAPGVWHIHRREREYNARSEIAFYRGGAVLLGLISMAEAIRTRNRMSYTPDNQLLCGPLAASHEALETLRERMMNRLRSNDWNGDHKTDLRHAVSQLIELQLTLTRL